MSRLYSIPFKKYYGGRSILVKANSRKEAENLVDRLLENNIDPHTWVVGESWDVEDLKDGEYISIGYFE